MNPPRIDISHLHHKPICTLIKPEVEGGALVTVEWSTRSTTLEVTTPGFNVAGVPYYVIELESKNGSVRDQMQVKKLVGWNELLPLPSLLKHLSMICLIWNCRGAGNEVFKRTMADLINTHHPDLLVLVETKVPLSSLNNFFINKGFTASSFSGPVGRSGGIWVLWDPTKIIVSAVEVTNQVIHATISKADFEDWIFSAVYGSNNPMARDLMWYDLQERAANDSRARLLAGDFNDHAESSEKRSFQRGTGKLKLNTDGSSRGNPGPAGYGGVFREERGHWILGFYGRLDDCTSLEAELWGIFRGLELVQSQGMEALEVDSDSTTAIALINEEAPEHSPYLILIKECKPLMASTGCSLKHIYREGNKVADKLANMGGDQEQKWVSHIEPPVVVIPLLEADMRGVAFERL